MSRNYPCLICGQVFSQSSNMKRHMNKIHDPMRKAREAKEFVCSICQKSFTRKYDMQKHVDTIHDRSTKTNDDRTYQTLISKIDRLAENNEKLKSELAENNERLKSELKEQISIELKNKSPTNQILNVICVTNHDNYLDMLTNSIGDFEQAIDYIKDCALSDLIGDCKLIEKIYANQNDEMSFSADHKNSKIFYQNEKNESITENKDSFARKLANNLQNSYLQSINYLINKNLTQKLNPNKFLDDYDIMTWNAHIYHLSDSSHQRKIMNQLRIHSK